MSGMKNRARATHTSSVVLTANRLTDREMHLGKRTLLRFVGIIKDNLEEAPIKYSELKSGKKKITGLSYDDVKDVVMTACRGTDARVYYNILMTHIQPHGKIKEDFVISPVYFRSTPHIPVLRRA